MGGTEEIIVLGRAWLEQGNDLVEAKLEALLAHATLDGLLSKETLLLLQVEDTLLDRLGDGELVDDDVDGLRETVDTINGLFFNKLGHVSRLFQTSYGYKDMYWVPEWLQDDDTRRRGEVESQTTALKTAQQDARLGVTPEAT